MESYDRGHNVGVYAGKFVPEVIFGNPALERSDVGCGYGAEVRIRMIVKW
jgi:hypothetical protein